MGNTVFIGGCAEHILRHRARALQPQTIPQGCGGRVESGSAKKRKFAFVGDEYGECEAVVS